MNLSEFLRDFPSNEDEYSVATHDLSQRRARAPVARADRRGITVRGQRYYLLRIMIFDSFLCFNAAKMGSFTDGSSSRSCKMGSFTDGIILKIMWEEESVLHHLPLNALANV